MVDLLMSVSLSSECRLCSTVQHSKTKMCANKTDHFRL